MPAKMRGLAIALGMLLVTSACATNQTPEAKEEPTGNSVAVQAVSDNKVAAAKIIIDGSSTVYPITEAIAGQLQLNKTQTRGTITVNFSGTRGGFEKFCTGKTDISNASRPILQAEIDKCQANGVEFIELPVAYDALTVVVNNKNTWAKDITVEELKKIWEPAAQGKITRWNQIRPEYPDQPLNLYGPGDESGTFDYFTEAIVGKTDSSRKDYVASEDDMALVRGVINDPNALGYFGYVYYKDNKGPIRALAINNGQGPVLPSRETVEKSQYQPLARPLFIYVNAKSVQSKPELKEFVEYYLQNAQLTVGTVGYIPLPEKIYRLAQQRFSSNKTGSVFAGKSETALQIEQLLELEQKAK
ncbi:PstS family phosphate ABC transporter substrate-binding protein [Calothrix sp. NIES-3974]|uniref:PstS family phosphate ABC transporter substrate-binding protein n=1 Tax=Calothrix sp. NIES-3974 TaxID=2005462 RepID=UPI000B5E41CC|nr:PstS family phosphate ABC transporter substrate-binding protein [Calothrix sp. NIES-3974]BAZ07841.1 ABC transporter, periplasmic phosphate-binding protein [Calothrix sp. NIES-3974]